VWVGLFAALRVSREQQLGRERSEDAFRRVEAAIRTERSYSIKCRPAPLGRSSAFPRVWGQRWTKGTIDSKGLHAALDELRAIRRQVFILYTWERMAPMQIVDYFAQDFFLLAALRRRPMSNRR
jgi:hypothetical protein